MISKRCTLINLPTRSFAMQKLPFRLLQRKGRRPTRRFRGQCLAVGAESDRTAGPVPARDLREMGWKALVAELGVTNATRFMLELREGEEDYVKLRGQLFAHRLEVRGVCDCDCRPRRHRLGRRAAPAPATCRGVGRSSSGDRTELSAGRDTAHSAARRGGTTRREPKLQCLRSLDKESRGPAFWSLAWPFHDRKGLSNIG